MTRSRSVLIVTTTAIALLAAACGSDDDTSTSTSTGDDPRTVEVDMVDIAFEPDTIEVTEGETVRFVFTNTGEIAHDAFIGDSDAQDDHEAEMREGDGDAHGGHGDDDSEAVTVEPGDTAELTHTFEAGDAIEIGCHQPGHYDAGMKLAIDVT